MHNKAHGASAIYETNTLPTKQPILDDETLNQSPNHDHKKDTFSAST